MTVSTFALMVSLAIASVHGFPANTTAFDSPQNVTTTNTTVFDSPHNVTTTNTTTFDSHNLTTPHKTTLSLGHNSTTTSNKTTEIIWDGRIPVRVALTGFDSYSSKYDPTYVHGDTGHNSTLSDFLFFPNVTSSKFDTANKTKAVGVFVNDYSVFNNETQYLRTELSPINKLRNGRDPTTEDITTFQFSLRPDPQRPLLINESQYNLAFIQSGNYQYDVWRLTVGQNYDNFSTQDETNNLRLLSSNGTTLFQTEWGKSTWYNFAITTHWDHNKLHAHFSLGNDDLEKVVEDSPTKTSDLGQIHIGVQKYSPDAHKTTGVEEGIIVGGIFVRKGDAARSAKKLV